ncbi:nucleoside triphosphate hydrolase [Paracoccus laeviglucosivorans]|uniref:Panthothenate kinase n=1 Tax=Paracoccus laeviglucosivorans TaxID=1197861 RepID=A0A521EBZ7_9RHOB|nr:nucleoside triphosphate hydrolase [Paracoccus laeviglucosivorans]SMO81443.1 Panthothenate kinase [Paracoccus laeviglucosivorans]
MSPSPDAIAADLLPRLMTLAAKGRQLVALAGPPGSGKSTIAEALHRAINAHTPATSAILPMDGFHYDDAVLRERGALSRKGAPHTFDVGGFRALLARLRANAEAEIAVPVFDRRLEISRAGARIIPQTTPLIIVEGNYLLLDSPPWTELAGQFDLTIALDVPMPVLRQRLIGRWLDHGMTLTEAEAKALGNDLPNAETVQAHGRAADITLTMGGEGEGD